jgi:predicted Zn-dependent peptidase
MTELGVSDVLHRTLGSGVELGVLPLADRRVMAVEIRIRTGMADEPADKLGIARILEDTIDKGTEQRDGRGLSDAFDALGTMRNSWAARESTGFTFTCLPEFFDQSLALMAEFIRTPTFPKDAVEVAVELTRQEHKTLEDDPQSLCDKILSKQAYGSLLGRHSLGEEDTVSSITNEDVRAHWQRTFGAGRMQVTVAGPVSPADVELQIDRHFGGFGSPDRAGATPFKVEFDARKTHHQKETAQQQIGIAYPGVALIDDEYPIERVMLNVLSGGMSSRLFTEVREKRGLVYYVSAWHEHPRGAGMIFLGASSTPERCAETYRTLLQEIDRLADDLTQEEVDRAVAGIVARTETREDRTRAKCGELADDLFHYGRPIATEEKLAKVKAVQVADIEKYLAEHSRDQLSVVTLGPMPLEA